MVDKRIKCIKVERIMTKKNNRISNRNLLATTASAAQNAKRSLEENNTGSRTRVGDTEWS